jgi:hypothetical protein
LEPVVLLNSSDHASAPGVIVVEGVQVATLLEGIPGAVAMAFRVRLDEMSIGV